MSVQCVHGTQRKPGNEAMSTIYLQFWSLFMSMYIFHKCDELVEMIRMFILLSFKLGTQSWNVQCTFSYWPLKLLTWFYFTIMIRYILNPHIKQKYHCTSPLAYRHCKLKWEKSVSTRLLNTSPTHFQCSGYLHIQMWIQTPLSDSPHNRFQYLYYTAADIQPNTLGLVFPCFQGSTLPSTCILYYTMTGIPSEHLSSYC